MAPTATWADPPGDWPALTAGVDWSIRVETADGVVLADHQPELILKTASVGKIFLLVEVARRLEAGELDPGLTVSWEDQELIADSGLWYLLDQRELGVEDVCRLVGAFSDNLATNVLVRLVGIDAVRAMSTALGCRRSALLDRVRDPRRPEDPPTLSVGSADELTRVMIMLHRGTAVSAAVSARVLRWLAAGADLSMVAAAFGFDPLAHAEVDRGMRLINKTGTISTARIDIGVVTGPAATVGYAVLANWPAGTDPRDDVLATMAAIGARIRAAVSA